MLSITITSNKDKIFFREVALAEKTTIGRDAACNISLPDPEKHLSRSHALIELRDGNYHLTVTSKTNPVMVNDKSCKHGQSIMLNEGDRIALSSYVLTVNALTKPQPTTPSPWADISAPSFGETDSDPFGLADLMAKPAAKSNIGPDPFEILTPAKHGNGLVDGIAPLHTNSHHNSLDNQLLDPMAALSKRGAHKPLGNSENIGRPQRSPFDDLLSPLSPSPQGNWNSVGSSQSSAPLVDMGGHRPAGTRSLEHVHDINLPFTPPPVMGVAPRIATPASANSAYAPKQPIDDPFADTLKTYLRPPPVSPEQSPQTPYQPNIAAVSSSGNVVANNKRQSTRRTKQRRATSTESEKTYISPYKENDANEQTNLLFNAFRNAAGLCNQPIADEDAISYMKSAGTIVRAAIEGITSLLASRSMLKGELGAEDRTMVASRDNNPLKLMPDIQDVMQFLFENKQLNSSAYLTPLQSIAGACEDLIYHELGTAAGMRAAVEGSIRRFNPQLIEAEFDKTGKKMVLNRKASLWEAYVENYRKIEVSMADDIGRIFERDFRRAYDDQIRKLKKK